MKRFGEKHSISAACAALLFLATAAFAITYGGPDNGGHPNVGVFAYRHPATGEITRLCSGTLISPTVFLTAAHCTAWLESQGITEVWVTFDPVFNPASPNLIPGTMYTNPQFSFVQSDPDDIAVITLDNPVTGITPAVLPPEGFFDRFSQEGKLKAQKFTSVGYGVHEPTYGGGPPTWASGGERWVSVSEFRALNNAWLHLSQNPATGDGGTCFGDSGGPNFLGSGANETPYIAGLTVKGDWMCQATNVIYRLDSSSAREFLDDFVTLP